MIERFLRQISVRQRIVGTFVFFIIVLALSIFLLLISLGGTLQQRQDFLESFALVDRRFLQASVYISNSRVNLMRYAQDTLPSSFEALNDIDQALELLQPIDVLLISAPDLQAEVRLINDDLIIYKTLIQQTQSARDAGALQDASRLEFQSLSLAGDLSKRIEDVVVSAQKIIDNLGLSFQNQLLQSVSLWLIAYSFVIFICILVAYWVQRSITQPVDVLRAGAEAFAAGETDISFPVSGSDELALLGQSFGQITTQLTQANKDLEQRVVERTKALEKRSAYFEAANEVGLATNSIVNGDELMRKSVALIRQQFDLYYVGLFLIDPLEEWAVLQAGTGKAGSAMLERGHRIKVGVGMIGWCVANAKSRVALVASEDAVRLTTPELPDTRSEAAIPLRSRGKVIGALTVQDDEKDAFDNDAIASLQIMADQLAVAISNVHLFAESQEALVAAQRAYGELTRSGWENLAIFQPDLGYLANAQGQVSTLSGSWQPEMVEASQTGALVQVEDENTIAIPIKSRDQVIGVVRLSKPLSADAWNAQELGVLDSIADQLGGALESARLYQQSQHLATQEQLIGEMTARMRSSLDVESVLQTSVRELRRLPGVVEAAIHIDFADTSATAPEVTRFGVGSEDES